jgi:hypothetical protein
MAEILGGHEVFIVAVVIFLFLLLVVHGLHHRVPVLFIGHVQLQLEISHSNGEVEHSLEHLHVVVAEAVQEEREPILEAAKAALNGDPGVVHFEVILLLCCSQFSAAWLLVRRNEFRVLPAAVGLVPCDLVVVRNRFGTLPRLSSLRSSASSVEKKMYLSPQQPSSLEKGRKTLGTFALGIPYSAL